MAIKAPNATPPAGETPSDFGDALDTAFSGAGVSTSADTTPDAPDNSAPAATAKPDPAAAAAATTPDPAAAAAAAKAKAPVIPSATTRTAKAAAGDSGDDIPAGLDEKAGAKWKEIRTEAKAARERAEAAEARIKEYEDKLKGFSETTEEVKTLRTRAEEQERELSITRVEATREFKSAIVEPMNAVLEGAKALAARYGLSEKEVVSALQNEDPDAQSEALQTLASTMGDRDRSRLYRMGDDLLSIAARKNLILSDAKASMARIEAKRAADFGAMDAAEKASLSSAHEEVWDALRAKSDFFNIDEDGVDDGHKAAIANANKIARGVDFANLSPKQKAYSAYAGSVFPYLMEVIGALQSQVAAANADLAGFRGAAPGAGAGAGAGDSMPVDTGDGDFGSGVDKAFGVG
jgi:hypothetical protein